MSVFQLGNLKAILKLIESRQLQLNSLSQFVKQIFRKTRKTLPKKDTSMNTLQIATRCLLGLLGTILFASTAVAQPDSFINLGIVGQSGSFTLDTIGSGFDTEIGIWDANGALLISDDDGGPGTESSATLTLNDGVYFVAISEFNSVFEDGFVNSGTAFEAGDIETAILNINGSQFGSRTIGEDPSVDQTAFFRFVVGSSPLGDVNRDGVVDFFDIAPFIDLLSFATFQVEADINQDLVVDFFDIQPFIDLLSGTGTK